MSCGGCGTFEQGAFTAPHGERITTSGLTGHVRLVCLILDLDNNGAAQATCALIGVEE